MKIPYSLDVYYFVIVLIVRGLKLINGVSRCTHTWYFGHNNSTVLSAYIVGVIQNVLKYLVCSVNFLTLINNINLTNFVIVTMTPGPDIPLVQGEELRCSNILVGA